MSHKNRILIVDDDVSTRTGLAEALHAIGYVVDTAADGFKALPKLDDHKPDVVLTDLQMPGLDGIQLIEKIRERELDAAVIVLTGFGAVDSAVRAMRAGAADYLLKPVNLDELELVLKRELERLALRREASRLREQLTAHRRVDDLLGASPAMQKIGDVVLQVAPSRATVLITGESGTGKERIAAALHDNSPRRSGPFIKLHCAALAESLLESELFGHERGAFTGALQRRAGRFEQADGGTLFLDEIGEISPNVQVKLLRFLQERELERVGGSETIKVDVRLVAATHRDLRECVRQGTFREDLYYRLNVVTIDLPPLRERASDIPLLASSFLARFAAENEKKLSGFSDDALRALVTYSWPGNVRELENAIERAVIVSRGERIEANDLSAAIVEASRPKPGAPIVPGASLPELERYAILRTLEHTGGSTSRAAEILQISPRTIQYRLREYQSEALLPERARPARMRASDGDA